jgi:uncharacterized small protein (DUF1192 family)
VVDLSLGDIPDLIAEVERLQKELEAADAENKALFDTHIDHENAIKENLSAEVERLQAELEKPKRKNDKRVAILAESRDKWKDRAKAVEVENEALKKAIKTWVLDMPVEEVTCFSCAINSGKNSSDKMIYCEQCYESGDWPGWIFEATRFVGKEADAE